MKHTPVKDKLETLVLVRGITGFTVRVVGVLIVGLLTRLAVLATWVKEQEGGLNEILCHFATATCTNIINFFLTAAFLI